MSSGSSLLYRSIVGIFRLSPKQGRIVWPQIRILRRRRRPPFERLDPKAVVDALRREAEIVRAEESRAAGDAPGRAASFEADIERAERRLGGASRPRT